MSCPTCDHTMHNLGLSNGGARVFWCPRCGSLKTESPGRENDFVETEMPKLVKLVRSVSLVPKNDCVGVPFRQWYEIDEASGFWNTCNSNKEVNA